MTDLLHETESLSGRMRRPGALALALGLVFAGPVSGGNSQAVAAPAPESLHMTDDEVNRSLESLAKKLAAAADDADLRRVIHGAVGKRFDGDENALWSSIAEGHPSFNAKVAGRKGNSEAIAHAAAKMPRLQIAVPALFDSWDSAAHAPLVAYFPEGVDDTKLTSITAYDAAGNAVPLDAQATPEQPVIVLSLNERTDEEGKLRKTSTDSSRMKRTAPDEYAVTAAATKYSVDVRMVHLIEDKEPWAKGDAEIDLKARSRGCSGVEYKATNWENLNNNDDWWAPGGVRNLGLTACDVVFYWWEDDGGNVDFTLGYGGFSLGVGMDDSDDLIGGKQVPYASFKGGGTDTWRKDEWPALAQWTE